MRIIATLLLVLTLCSCDAPVYHGRVRTASFDQIKMPAKMMFTTVGDTWMAGASYGIIGGASGGLLGDSLTSAHKQAQPLSEFFHQDLERALTEAINQTGKLTILPTGKGEGRVKVEVSRWGFIAAKLTSSKLGPAMGGKFYLQDAEGKTVWWTYLLPSLVKVPEKPAPPPPALHYPSELESSEALQKQELSRTIRLVAHGVASRMQFGSKRRK